MNDVNESEVKDIMLSTSDNPFNPFTQFEQWFAFDVAHGYNTCQYLANVCDYTDSFGEKEEALSINEAIEEALYFNITGNRIAVMKPKEGSDEIIQVV